MRQQAHKRYKSTKDIPLRVLNIDTATMNWKKDHEYQSYWRTTNLFGTELCIDTEERNMPSVVTTEWLRENGFVEVTGEPTQKGDRTHDQRATHRNQ